jgi:hypothetical protein
MEVALSISAKGAIATSSADIRALAEACESLPYTTYRGHAERATYVQFLMHAKNVATYLDTLSRIRGDVSLLLPAVKVELRRALVRCEYMPDGGMHSRLKSRLLCAQERVEAVNGGMR